jgi:hypothetical protein
MAEISRLRYRKEMVESACSTLKFPESYKSNSY